MVGTGRLLYSLGEGPATFTVGAIGGLCLFRHWPYVRSHLALPDLPS